VLDHALGDATHHDVRQARPPMRSDHDDIRANLARAVRYLGDRASLHNLRRARHPARLHLESTMNAKRWVYQFYDLVGYGNSRKINIRSVAA